MNVLVKKVLMIEKKPTNYRINWWTDMTKTIKDSEAVLLSHQNI